MAGSGRGHRVWELIGERAGGRGNATAGDVCAACVSAVGVSGAGLWVGDTVDRRIMAHCTDPVAERLEDLQFVLGEGPCTQAWTSGAPVLVEDLGARQWQQAWPGFAAAAVRLGAGAVFAFPLQAGAVRAGTLDLYRDETGPLEPAQLADALAFASAALTVMLALPELLVPESVLSVDGIGQDASVIHRAAGMVSVQLAVDIDAAYARIRAYAFAHDLPLREVARRIEGRELRFEPENQEDG
ncbi:GAF domain-containing protein [Actinomadura sp. KC06]|uniref:GAF domain-containing protein n=1 Tax=Actinomadura sp. KC06 TaxID=2530369 RepID=UPI00104A2A58|nr:GAF domain-containing protein [Actinomadura sp. KC06]TDD33080.1 GAF domain-containing protein [Actinomadura sp. KC06]